MNDEEILQKNVTDFRNKVVDKVKNHITNYMDEYFTNILQDTFQELVSEMSDVCGNDNVELRHGTEVYVNGKYNQILSDYLVNMFVQRLYDYHL